MMNMKFLFWVSMVTVYLSIYWVENKLCEQISHVFVYFNFHRKKLRGQPVTVVDMC